MRRLLPLIALLPLLALGCVPSAETVQDERVVYNKYNIHTQYGDGVYKASYANYTDPGAGHTIFPPGTKLRVVKKNRKAITFLAAKPDKEVKILFEVHEPRMAMSVDEYIDLITSPDPVSTKNLSDLDQKGIDGGKALPGMTKQGVLAALGYPARHRTPSVESTRWVYWTNRFKTRAVDFDANSKVASVTD